MQSKFEGQDLCTVNVMDSDCLLLTLVFLLSFTQEIACKKEK